MEWMQRKRAFKAEGAALKEFSVSLFGKQWLNIPHWAHPLVWGLSEFRNMVSGNVVGDPLHLNLPVTW